ncbi:MAG: phospholipase D family protein [Chromatiaceae bacterium]|nr:phospholipase D family protein [Chromatiaceae bacterium]
MLIRGWKAMFWLLLASLGGGCAVLPENVDRVESHAYTATDDTMLGHRFAAERAEHPDMSGFLLLGRGLDAFLIRAVLAQTAERSIDAQYYLLHDDLTGRLFIDQLLKAADRGVRVRLLVDDMDLAGRDWGARILDAHPNVQVRIFNPFSRNIGRIPQFVTGLGSVTRRMHNKSFTVDSQATVLGGRNIGDEYFEANPDLAFSDLDVLAVGPLARDVSMSFDRYWNHPLAYPVATLVPDAPSAGQLDEARARLGAFVKEHDDSAYLTALRQSPLADRLRAGGMDLQWGSAELVSDDPEKLLASRQEVEYRLAKDLAPHFDGLRRELIVFSPYFVPGEEGVDFFRGLRARGVRVRILTNSLASTDVSAVHAGYARYREDLLRAGVELYELNKRLGKEAHPQHAASGGSSKASLHAKSFVLDREEMFVGSLNLDPRSVVENTEIGVVFRSPQIAREMADWFDANIENLAFQVKLEQDANGAEQLRWYGRVDGEPQIFHVDPYTSFWKRFMVGAIGLLPVESQL